MTPALQLLIIDPCLACIIKLNISNILYFVKCIMWFLSILFVTFMKILLLTSTCLHVCFMQYFYFYVIFKHFTSTLVHVPTGVLVKIDCLKHCYLRKFLLYSADVCHFFQNNFFCLFDLKEG